MSIKEYINQFVVGTKTMFKEFFNKETNKKQRANMWTFSRLITSIIIPILAILGSIFSSTIILGMVTATASFGALTDYFDGKSARKHNSYSEYGKLLDQFADKIFAMMLGVTLSVFNPIFLLTLLGEGLIAGTNIIYKKKYKKMNIKSTMIGKIKQWPLFASLGLGFVSALIPGLTNIVNYATLTTFLFQLMTISSYVEQNNKEKRKLKLEEIQDYINQITYNSSEKEKTNTIEKTNNNMSNTNSLSRKEQYLRLRNVLNSIIELNSIEEETIVEENEYGKQKIKNDLK